ncbi:MULTISPECIES: hypothetical protein [Rhodobacterales]|uniref:Uncharacterized protein n=1 Tax=Halocynthiibacter styelae TaxID=2761955 RepID=A0A8J7IQB9_9RHOB|nr:MULTISPECIES: hypothetical protein [Rhodobacterales]MBI1495226.1 hypothetical protein [Paenihalocynthiibacter styelae]
MKTVTIMATTIATVALAGCIDQQSYATTPVQVETEKGTVVCQLYTENRVLWDEAILAPEGMTIREANNVCIREGNRRLANR